MKKLSRVLSLFAFLFLLPLCANATTVDFYTDGTITDGDSYTTVNIWDTATVDMTGGNVSACNINNFASLISDNGSIGIIACCDNSTADILGGSFDVAYLAEDSKMCIYGGIWSNGTDIDIYMYDNSELHIFGYDLEHTDQYILHGRTLDAITGYWENGQEFTIILSGPAVDNYFLHEIPEPSTMSLLSLCAFFIKKAKHGMRTSII